MAAINLLVREPVIPFIKVKKDEDLEEVTLSNTIMQVVNVGGVPMPLKQNRTAMIVKCMDDDIETLIRCCNTFLEATSVDALSLSEGQYYTEFRKCLRNIVLEAYDQIVDAVVNRNAVNFNVVLTSLISTFCKPTAYADQRRYMETYSKPFKIKVRQLSNRLVLVNKYTRFLPGSGVFLASS